MVKIVCYIKCFVLDEYVALKPQYEKWRISTTEPVRPDGIATDVMKIMQHCNRSMKYGGYLLLILSDLLLV